MNYKFEQGEIVQFDDEKFGKGTGGVVGYCKDSDVYMIYPKIEHDYENYPFMCIPIKSKNLISTPF
jgi:hypothetical protein